VAADGGLAREMIRHRVENRAWRQGRARVVEVDHAGHAGRVRPEPLDVEGHRLPARGAVACSRKRSATATCIAMPLASADSLTTIRGERFGNATSVSGRVLRFAMAPGTRWST